MSTENIKDLFEEGMGLDYTNITKEQKIAIRECVKILNEFGMSPIGTRILERTGLEVIPEYDIEASPFYQLMRECNIGFNIQGHVHDGERRYQVCGVYSDIRELDKALLKYKDKVRKKFW